MNESDLLAHIARTAAAYPMGPDVLVGPGDDCAVLRIAGDLLVTVDQLIEGRHYAAGTPLDLVARKAMARAISDIAAMAGVPIAAVVAGACPRGFPDGEALVDAIHAWGRHFACPVVGGDLATHDAPVALSVTILGRPHERRGPVLRSTARVGDSVWVTGPLGGSFRSGRHLTFEPRVAMGVKLADRLGPHLTAMIDISDGLGRDAGRIAEASGVRIELRAGDIPLAPGVASWRQGASDGEDYELLFTVDADAKDLQSLAPLECVRIGAVVPGAGCVIGGPDGSEIDARALGWDHA